MTKDILYQAILEVEQDKNMKILAEILGDFTPRGLSKEEQKQYTLTRKVVLNYYFLTEVILNKIVTFYTLRCSSEIISNNLDASFEKLFDCWVDIPYKKKIRLIETISKSNDIDFKVLHKLDDFRDMFAHNFPLKNKRYNYNGHNIVRSKTARDTFFNKFINQLIKLRKLKEREESCTLLHVASATRHQ